MTWIGITPEGRKLISAKTAFDLYDTHGLPLDLIIDLLYEKDYLINWVEFYDIAVSRGWNPDSTLVKIDMAIRYTLGAQAADHIVAGLKVYITHWDDYQDLRDRDYAPKEKE